VGWVAEVSTFSALGLVAGVALVAVVILQGWFCVELLRQNGRVLARIDEIEATLTAGDAPAALNRSPQLAAGGGLEAPIGRVAPSVSLPDIDGKTVTLDDLRGAGRPVMLVFSDPGCGPCNALLPQLAAWQEQHAGTLTIALVSRGGADTNRRKGRDRPLKHVLIQADREVAEAYDAHGTPSAVLVNLDGRVASDLAHGSEAIAALVERVVKPPLAVHHVPATANGIPTVRQAVHPNGNAGQGARGPAGSRVGEPAPALTLPSLAGEPTRLSDFEGHELLLAF